MSWTVAVVAHGLVKAFDPDCVKLSEEQRKDLILLFSDAYVATCPRDFSETRDLFRAVAAMVVSAR